MTQPQSGRLAAALRKLAAHFDPDDPTRKPGRRMGSTESPYTCDFEIGEEFGEDVAIVVNYLSQFIPPAET